MPITADPRGSWSERNITTITECMDVAFAKVVADKFDWMTGPMKSAQKNDWLRRSEQSILRLRNSGNMPNYNDRMVILRYVVQYQLRHINLAYTLIKDATATGDNRLTRTSRLQVADFGAGCLAMQFGLALAVADALESGEDIAGVWLDSIDTSRLMMELGKFLWQEFVNQVGQSNDLHFLTEAANLIQPQFHEQHDAVQEFDGMDHWVSALHTVYGSSEQQCEVSNALRDLCDKLRPDHVFVTCHEQKKDLAKRALPTSQQWVDDNGKRPHLRFSGFIKDSHVTYVASKRYIRPSTWNHLNLYPDVTGAWAFTSRNVEAE